MASFLLAPPEFRTLEVDYVDPKGEDGKLKIRLRVFTCADVGRIEAEYGRAWLATIAEANDLDSAIAVFAGQIENVDEVLDAVGEDDIVEGMKRCIPVSNEAVIGIMQTLAGLFERAMVDASKKKRRLRNRRLKTGLIKLALSFCAGAAALYLSMTFWP